MKLPAILFFILSIFSSQAEITYKFDLINDDHYVGELNYFQLQSTSKIQIEKLPEVEGIKWLKTRYSQTNRQVNGENIVIYKAMLNFFAKESKLFRLPVIESKLDDTLIYLKAKPFEVKRSRSDSEKFVRILYDGKPEAHEYFVGQSIDLDLLVFKKAGSQESVLHPSVELNNAKLYRYKNPGLNLGMGNNSSIYYKFTSGVYQDIKNKELDGKTWDIRRYKVTAQLMRSGKVTGEVLTFVTENGRKMPIVNKFSFDVKEVPENRSKNVFDSRLTGEWDINAKLSTDKIEANKTFTYTVNFKGTGDLRRLEIPKLEIPGIKTVNSEFIKNEEFVNQWKGSLTYSLYASKDASQLPEIKMSYFNTKSQQHEVIELSKPHPVIGGADILKSDKVKKPLAANDLVLGEDIRKPLYLNLPAWLAILFFVMPLIFVCSPWLKKLAVKPEVRKSKDLLKRRTNLVKKCEVVSEDQVPQLIKKDLIPLLIDTYQLPQGSTVEEIIPYIKCEKLQQLLLNFNQSSYSGKKYELCPGSLKKAIHNLSIALMLIFSSAAMAETPNEVSFDAANDAFSKAEYDKAVKQFKELLKLHPNNVSVHYNLGNTYYKNGDYNRARASYHAALMLNPSHEGCNKNLNQLNEETNYSGPPGNPLNFLRTDHWLALFIVTWSVFWLIITVLKMKKKRIAETVYCGTAVLGLLSAILYFQIFISYAEGRYQVITDNAVCYDKPGTISKTLNKIPSGTEFIILKTSQDYALVQSEGRQFWLNTKNLQKIW